MTCPYRQAFDLLERARAEGVTVEHSAERQGFRAPGASPAFLRVFRAATGVAVFTVGLDITESEAGAWLAMAKAFASTLRVTRGANGSVIVTEMLAPQRLALARMVQADRAAREVLTLDVVLLRELPVPWTLHLERREPGQVERERWGARRSPWVVTTSSVAYRRAQEAGTPAFVARELEAAALAVEHVRAYPGDLDRWLAAKRRGDWRLTHELADAVGVGGVTALTRPTWALGRVLDGLDTDLVRVELHETKGA